MADTLDLGSSAARCADSTPRPERFLFFAATARGSSPRGDLLAWRTAAKQRYPSQRETGNRNVCCGP